MLPVNFLWPHGKRAALSLTFDDARLSQIDSGMSILNSHGTRATFYVLPEAVKERLAGWREAVAAGHEIGNHTVTHPCSCNQPFSRNNGLEDYTLERIAAEITGADDAIQELLGVRPRTFAYPCGNAFVGRGRENHSYVPLIAEHFLAGRSAGLAPTADPEICDLAFLPATGADNVPAEKLIQRLEDLIEADQPQWLILVAHEVDTPGMAPETLKAICQFAEEKQEVLWTDTVAAIAEFVRESRVEDG